MADAFNNLSDAASSIVGLVGVKMAEKRRIKTIPLAMEELNIFLLLLWHLL